MESNNQGTDGQFLMAFKRDKAKEASFWNNYWHQKGNDELEVIVRYFEPYTRIMTKKYYQLYGSSDTDFDDFLQNANMGLLESIQRYDPSLNVDFVAFSVHRIRGSILSNIKYMSERTSYTSHLKQLRQERLKSLVEPDKEDTSENLNLDTLILQIAYGHLLDSIPDQYIFDKNENEYNPY